MNKQKWTEKPVTWYVVNPCLSRPGGSGFERRLERRSTIGPGKGIVSKGREPLQQAAPFLFLSTEVVFTKTGLRP